MAWPLCKNAFDAAGPYSVADSGGSLGEARSPPIIDSQQRLAGVGRRLRRNGRLIPAHPDGRVALYLQEVADQRGLVGVQDSKIDVIQESVAISENAVRNALNHLEAAKIISRDSRGVITIQDRRALESHLIL